MSDCLRSQPLGVAGEHAGLPDVVQPQVEHGDPLQPDATPGVGRTAVPEAVDVSRDGGDINPVMFCTLSEILRVEDPLSSGQNLLAPHEHVVAVAVLHVRGVWHGVERPDRQGELVL